MKFTRHTACTSCGGKSIDYRLDRPLMQAHLSKLVSLGFSTTPHFLEAGILYATNEELILTGPFGSDRLHIKCKVVNCDNNLNDLESLLQQLE